jgi:hypothetical protein
MHLPESEIKPRQGLSWPRPILFYGYPHGAELRNRCDTSANPRGAYIVLARLGVFLILFALFTAPGESSTRTRTPH